MSNAQQVTTSSGFGLGTVLFIVFLILKLTHTIDWSWWWVTSPLWISAGFVIIVLLIIMVIAICAAMLK
jgi:hypothetical protein